MAGEPGAAGEAEGKPPEISKRVLDFIKPVPVEGDELRQKLDPQGETRPEAADAYLFSGGHRCGAVIPVRYKPLACPQTPTTLRR